MSHKKIKYLWVAIVLFFVEIFIAKYVHDAIIRPYIGDVLVVILIYCVVKAFSNVSTIKAAIGVMLFSFVVEFLQYVKIINWLGLQNNKLATIIIGTSFSWVDILCYTTGIIVVMAVEKTRC